VVQANSMGRNLLTTLTLSLLNPSKRELNAMADLLAKSTPIMRPTVRYTVFEGMDPVRTNLIRGRVPNIRVVNYLAAFDYNEVDLRVSVRGSVVCNTRPLQ